MRLPLLVLLLATATHAAEFKIGLHTFTLPDGLTVELAAGPPLVNRPIPMAFGDRGELYVADSSGPNDKVEKQLAEKPHGIFRLRETNDQGTESESRYDSDMAACIGKGNPEVEKNIATMKQWAKEEK